MQVIPTLRIWLPVATVAVLMLVAMPAAAENSQLTVSAKPYVIGADGTSLSNGRLAPETAILKIRFTFDVVVPSASRCAGVVNLDFAGPPPSPMYRTTLSPSTLSRHFDGDGGAAGPADSLVSPTGTTMKDWVTDLTVQFTRDAPAFMSIALPVKAQARLSEGSQCNLDPSDQITSEPYVIADYFPLMQYTPATYSAKAVPNGDVVFKVKAANLGNGASRITTTLKAINGGIEALVPPADALIESEVQSGATATDEAILQLTARAPKHAGYSNSVSQFQATFRAKAEAGPGATGVPVDETTIVLVLKVQGVSLPGFDVGPAIAGLGIGLVAMFGRRRSC